MSGFANAIGWLIASPPRFYLLTALCAGIVSLFLTPPMQVPDEPSHFYRAYQLAEGRLIAETHDDMAGGHLPRSLKDFKQTFDHLPFSPESKVEKGQYRDLLGQDLTPHKKEFASFEVTALYSPVPYVPQVAGVWIGKLFHAPPVALLWLGRFFNVLFSVTIVFLAIRLAPAYRWVFALIAMMPMAIFLKSSLSPDAMTNALAILFVALVMRYSLTRIPVNLLALLSVAVLLGLSKNAYMVLLLLAFIIPDDKYRSFSHYLIVRTAIPLAGSLAAAAWSVFVSDIYVPFQGAANVDPVAQLQHIFSDFSSYLYIVWFNTFAYWDKYIIGMVGNLGWVDTPMPNWLVTLYVMVLIFLALVDTRKSSPISWQSRAIVLIIVGLSILVIKTLLYLSTEPVGSTAITTVQGRYYIPVAAVILLVLYGNYSARCTRKNGLICWLRDKRSALAASTVAISTITMFVVLSERYYS